MMVKTEGATKSEYSSSREVRGAGGGRVMGAEARSASTRSRDEVLEAGDAGSTSDASGIGEAGSQMEASKSTV